MAAQTCKCDPIVSFLLFARPLLLFMMSQRDSLLPSCVCARTSNMWPWCDFYLTLSLYSFIMLSWCDQLVMVCADGLLRYQKRTEEPLGQLSSPRALETCVRSHIVTHDAARHACSQLYCHTHTCDIPTCTFFFFLWALPYGYSRKWMSSS